MTHGTKSAYEKRGCRCDACRGWKRATDSHKALRLRERVAAGDPSLRHGTTYLYSRGGCRCQPCCDVAGAAQRAYVSEQELVAGEPRKSGVAWTGAELDLVVSRRDLTLTELARLLGRSRSSVIGARSRATHDPKWVAVAGTVADEV